MAACSLSFLFQVKGCRVFFFSCDRRARDSCHGATLDESVEKTDA